MNPVRDKNSGQWEAHENERDFKGIEQIQLGTEALLFAADRDKNIIP